MAEGATAELGQAILQLGVDLATFCTEFNAAEKLTNEILARLDKHAADTGKKISKGLGAAFNFNQVVGAWDQVVAKLRPAIDYTKQSIGAAMEAELAETKLGAALQSRGIYAAEAMDAANRAATSIQNLTNADDENLKTTAALIIATTDLSNDALPGLMQASVAAGALLKKNGEDAAMGPALLRKAIAGTKTEAGEAMAAFSRMGIVVKDTGTTVGNLGAILNALRPGWDMAIAGAQTASGELDRVKIQWGEVQEAFGRGLIGGADGTTLLKAIGDELYKLANDGSVEKLGKAFGDLADALPSIINELGPAVEKLSKFIIEREKLKGMNMLEIANLEAQRQLGRAAPYGVKQSEWDLQGPQLPTGYRGNRPPDDAGAGDYGPGSGGGATGGAEAAAEARIKAIFEMYAKGGEFRKAALKLDPSILKDWKALASDIEVAAFEAGELTDANKALADAAKKAAEAEKAYIAEIQKNYESTIDQYNAGTEAFREWFDTFDPSMKQAAKDWQTATMSAGEYYQVMFEQEEGFDRVAQTFKDIPIWAIEAWDSADGAAQQYLQKTYGLTDEIENAYQDMFGNIGTTAQQAMAEMMDKHEAIINSYTYGTELEAAGLGVKKESLQITGDLLQKELSTTDNKGRQNELQEAMLQNQKAQLEVDIKIAEVEKRMAANEVLKLYARAADTKKESEKRDLLQQAALKQFDVEKSTLKEMGTRQALKLLMDNAVSTSQSRLDNERKITREVSQQAMILSGMIGYTTSAEAARYGQYAAQVGASGGTDAALAALQQMQARIQFDMATGKRGPGSYQYGGMTFGGAGFGGREQGALSDIQQLIQMLQLWLQANPQKGQQGAAVGTDANPVKVQIVGGGMGSTMLEAMA